MSLFHSFCRLFSTLSRPGRPRRSSLYTHQAGRWLRVEGLEERYLLSTTLIRDIVSGPADSNPTGLVQFFGGVFFIANNRVYGSDGSGGGTAEVPGFVGRATSLVASNRDLFVTTRGPNAFDFNNIYKIDGATGETVLLHSSMSRGSCFTLVSTGDRVFFRCGTPPPGPSAQLWTSDGTPAGTIPLTSIPLFNSNFSRFINVNGTLFFQGLGADQGTELHKSDGTPAGTGLVKDIRPGLQTSFPTALVNVGGLLYFSADDGVHGRELWVSDGTEQGTRMVQDIRPGPESSDPQNIIEGFFTYALFSADDGVHGRELWLAPGFNTGGPEMIRDINPGPASSNPENLIDVSGYLFFTADTPEFGRELWFSDWLPDSTYLLKDINPGPASSNPDKLTSLFGYYVYFSADDGVSGRELYVSDWTTDGTFQEADLNPAGSSDPDFLVELGNGYIYFAATRPDVGRELFAASPFVGPSGAPGAGDGRLDGSADMVWGLDQMVESLAGSRRRPQGIVYGPPL